MNTLNELLYYCEEPEPVGAVLLTGEWGCGKTYLIDNELKEALENRTHAEFVRIHPFLDGNGRTSRLLMNYQLMGKGFLPIYIAKEDRLAYYNALDQYAVHGRLDDFADMIALLEEKKLDKYLELAAIQEQE